MSSEWRVLSHAVAPDRRLDPAGTGARRALDEREVAPLDGATADQLLQARVRLLRAGDDEQAGGVPVEPVDDPGRSSSPPAASCASRPCTSVPLGAPCRMDDDACRLVDHEQVLVLPDDVEVHLLRDEWCGVGRELDDDLLPALEPVALGPRLAVDEDGALGDQPLCERA